MLFIYLSKGWIFQYKSLFLVLQTIVGVMKIVGGWEMKIEDSIFFTFVGLRSNYYGLLLYLDESNRKSNKL